MRHGVKKNQFKGGRDANRSIERKLLVAFLEHGQLEITIKRAKALRQSIDILAGKAKRGQESDKNVLLRRLGKTAMVSYMIDTVGPALSDRESGYVRIVSTSMRMGDNVKLARISWVKPVTAFRSNKAGDKSIAKIEKEPTASKPEKKAEPKTFANKKVIKSVKKELPSKQMSKRIKV